MKKCIIIIILSITILCCIVVKDYTEKLNNDIDADDIVTVKYSEFEINELKQRICSNKVHYFEFRAKFKIQCLRKTHRGYYVILLQDDGKKVFVFMNDSLILNNILIVDEFKNKKDFDSIITKQKSTTIDEILAFDNNTILLPISAVNVTSHIVKEGVLCIWYVYDEELEKLIVSKVDLISNIDLLNEFNDFLVLNTPYILEIDKNE